MEILKTKNSIKLVSDDLKFIVEFSKKDIDTSVGDEGFYEIGNGKKGVRLAGAEVFLSLTDDEVNKIKKLLEEE
jgi:hypothetical protein